MKWILNILLNFLILSPGFATNYYQTYDIVVSPNSNSLNLQVYDLTLMQFQSTTTNSVSGTLNYQYSDGVVCYAGSNTMGCVTYDLETNQFNSYSNGLTGPITISCNDGVAAWLGNNSYCLAIYDIVEHQWKITSNGLSNGTLLSNNDGVVGFVNSNSYVIATYDPELHQWQTSTNGITGATQIVSSDGLVAISGSNTYFLAIYDPENHQWQTNSNGLSGSGIVRNQDGMACFTNSNSYVFATYDPFLQQIVTTSNGLSNIVKTSCNGKVAACASVNTVTCGTYDYSTHQWQTYTNGFNIDTSTFNVTNGTVTFTAAGNGVVLGYNLNTGNWGNNPTIFNSLFFLTNLNNQSGQQLIHVRNLSLGTSNTNYDFGDGITSPNQCIWHLYKTNGHYRTSGIYQVCLTTNASGGSQNSCQTVNMPLTSSDEESNYCAALKLFPNPAADMLFIDLKQVNCNSEFEIIICDATGKTIYCAVNQECLDIRAIKPGIYAVIVKVNNKAFTSTITKL